MAREIPLQFTCAGTNLYGMLHAADGPAQRGLLIVVGGPQYRVGSHRQFLLLARDLAATGIPVLRFDYRGMGDSEGQSAEPEACEGLDQDIRSALDVFFQRAAGLEEVTIFGLCDAASAALLYAHSDRRVSGVVLLNPWLSTQQGAAKTYLKNYYRQRLFSPQLWKKVVTGEFSFRDSVSSLWRKAWEASGLTAAPEKVAGVAKATLAERTAQGLARFKGKVLLILSGDDRVAAEFLSIANTLQPWPRLLKDTRVTRHDLAEADHTFSRRVWRDQVMSLTRDWLKS